MRVASTNTAPRPRWLLALPCGLIGISVIALTCPDKSRAAATELAGYKAKVADMGLNPSPPHPRQRRLLWAKVLTHPLFAPSKVSSGEFVGGRYGSPDLLRADLQTNAPLISLILDAATNERSILGPPTVPEGSQAQISPTSIESDDHEGLQTPGVKLVSWSWSGTSQNSARWLCARARLIAHDQGQLAGLRALLPVAKMIGFHRSDPRIIIHLDLDGHFAVLMEAIQSMLDLGPLSGEARRAIGEIASSLGVMPSLSEVFWVQLQHLDGLLLSNPPAILATGGSNSPSDQTPTKAIRPVRADVLAISRTVMWKHGVRILSALQTRDSAHGLEQKLIEIQYDMAADPDPIAQWITGHFGQYSGWAMTLIKHHVLEDLLKVMATSSEAQGKVNDRFSGAPLRYRTVGDTAVFYSVGSDFIDDNGLIAPTSKQLLGSFIPQRGPSDLGFRIRLK